jgi:hypothetical protein
MKLDNLPTTGVRWGLRLVIALGSLAVIGGGQAAIADVLTTTTSTPTTSTTTSNTASNTASSTAEIIGNRTPILWFNNPDQPVTLVTGRILTMDNDRVLLQLPEGGTLLIGVTGYDRDRLGLQPGAEVTAALVERSFFAQAIVLGSTLDLNQVEQAAQGQAAGAIDSWSRTSPDQTTPIRTGTVATGTVRTGTVRTGTVETGTVHTGSVQTGTVRTGTVETGTVRTGSVQTGTTETGAVRSRTVLERRTVERRAATGCVLPCEEAERVDWAEDCDRTTLDTRPNTEEDCWVEVESVEPVEHPTVQTQSVQTQSVQTQSVQTQSVEHPAPSETHAPVRGLW